MGLQAPHAGLSLRGLDLGPVLGSISSIPVLSHSPLPSSPRAARDLLWCHSRLPPTARLLPKHTSHLMADWQRHRSGSPDAGIAITASMTDLPPE
eukprot:g38140.t1